MDDRRSILHTPSTKKEKKVNNTSEGTTVVFSNSPSVSLKRQLEHIWVTHNVVDPKMSAKEIKVLMMIQFHVLAGTTLTVLQVFVVRRP